MRITIAIESVLAYEDPQLSPGDLSEGSIRLSPLSEKAFNILKANLMLCDELTYELMTTATSSRLIISQGVKQAASSRNHGSDVGRLELGNSPAPNVSRSRLY